MSFVGGHSRSVSTNHLHEDASSKPLTDRLMASRLTEEEQPVHDQVVDRPMLSDPEVWDHKVADLNPEPVKLSDLDAEATARLRSRTSARGLIERKLPAEERLLGSLVTCTSRMFLVAKTGSGKTLFSLAIAGGISSGVGFLNWASSRPARVLYIDGEMPLATLQLRVQDLARRLDSIETLDNLYVISWQDAGTLEVGEWAPLNTASGQQFILRLCELIQPDVVIFDNVMALVSGDMKDETPWSETWPLIAELTARNIGQIWIDHTGHQADRQYGTSTKAWKFDTVGILTPLPREECAQGETAFTLSFDGSGKARNRTPETWHEYVPQTIRLHDDNWTTSASIVIKKSKGSDLAYGDQVGLRILKQTIELQGISVTVGGDDTQRLAVREDDWRTLFYSQGKPTAKQDTKRKGFKRTMDSLLVNNRIGMSDGLVWIK